MADDRRRLHIEDMAASIEAAKQAIARNKKLIAETDIYIRESKERIDACKKRMKEIK